MKESTPDSVQHRLRLHALVCLSLRLITRSAWGDGLDDASDNQEDGPYDLDRSIAEEAFVEEDREVCTTECSSRR